MLRYNSKILRNKMKKTIALLLLSILFTGCATHNFHRKGDYYSGVSNVGEKLSIYSRDYTGKEYYFDLTEENKKYKHKNHDPSGGGIGVGYALHELGGKIVGGIYNVIDFIFSGVADTLLVPFDIYYRNDFKVFLEADKHIRDKEYGLKMHQSRIIPSYSDKRHLKSNDLLHFISVNDTAEVSKILDKDSSYINDEDIYENSALCYAVYLSNLDVIKLLIHHGAINHYTLMYQALHPNNNADLEVLKYLQKTDIHRDDPAYLKRLGQ